MYNRRKVRHVKGVRRMLDNNVGVRVRGCVFPQNLCLERVNIESRPGIMDMN